MDSYMYVRSVALYRTVPWSDFLRSQQGLFFFFPCVWIKIGVKKKKNREMSTKEGYEEAKKQNKEKEK